MRTRNKFGLLQLLLVCYMMCGMHAAQAKTSTYSVQASISSTLDWPLNRAFTPGGALTGEFTLDDSKQAETDWPPTGTTHYYGSVTEAHFKTQALSFDMANGSTSVTPHDPSFDHVSFLVDQSAGGKISGTPISGLGIPELYGYTLVGWELWLGAPQSTNNTAFPTTSWITNPANVGSISLYYVDNRGAYSWVSAEISQIAAVSPVPEPSSVAMLSLGLTGLLLRRRKSRG